MLKKKCFAALSGILLAISIIAPFSFSKVNAEPTGDPVVRVLYSFESANGETYVHCDFIYTNTNPTSYGMIIFNYMREGVVPSIGLTAGTGVDSIEYENYTDNSNGYRRYFISYSMTGFFIVRITFKGASTYWNQAALHNPTSKLGLQFQNTTTGYSADVWDNNTIYLWQISNYLRNGLSIDTSDIETLLNQIVTNQQTIIANQNNGNQAAQDVVENNDEQISDGIDIVDEYDSLTSTFDSDFVDSQEDIQDIMSNSSLTQFSDAAIWFTQQLASLYNSMGDMKILVTLPLLLGIALFFIGRGNVIFRDPNTEQWSSGTNYTYDDNGNSHVTSYTNYRVTERKRTKDGGK